MRKFIFIFLLVISSISSAAVMRSYRLVWDTSKFASFGAGLGYSIFRPEPPDKLTIESSRDIRYKIFGPIAEVEVGITGYEYLAGLKVGHQLDRAKNTYIITVFTGKSQNWMDLKTNIKKNHYVFGVRITRKFNTLAIKYHTDFEKKKMISVQFGIGE